MAVVITAEKAAQLPIPSRMLLLLPSITQFLRSRPPSSKSVGTGITGMWPCNGGTSLNPLGRLQTSDAKAPPPASWREN